MKSESTAKERLFETAAGLFYRQGYRATGVDTIAAASGIGKMTLYRHYPSKDDLIVAYLRDSDEEFWAGFEQITAGATTASTWPATWPGRTTSTSTADASLSTPAATASTPTAQSR